MRLIRPLAIHANMSRKVQKYQEEEEDEEEEEEEKHDQLKTNILTISIS